MKRIFLLIATNMAVLLVFSVAWSILDSIFGISEMLVGMGLPVQFGSIAVMALVFGFGGAFVSLLMSKGMAKRSMGVQVIEQPATSQERWLVETVARQAKQAGIGMPEVGIFHSPEPNAFATGAKKNDALVAVSQGLLDHMTQDEVEAVLGHEISHVANGDMVTQTLIQGVLNTFVIVLSRVIGYAINSFLNRGNENSNSLGIGYYVSTIVLDMLFGLVASMIVMWHSRHREFYADKGGAELAGREKMIAALQRLQQVSQPHDLPGEMAAFGIAGGVKAGLSKLMMTHPPLEQRISALKNRDY